MKKKYFFFSFLFILFITWKFFFPRPQANPTLLPEVVMKKKSAPFIYTAKISPKKIKALRTIATQKNNIAAIEQNNSFEIKSMGVHFFKNIFACAESLCEQGDSILTTNGFHLFKGEIPNQLDSRSNALVTFNKTISRYGIWERRIILETKKPVDLAPFLEELKLQSIERVQPQLFIVEYVGQLKNIDLVLIELKSLPEIKDVRLEISYSRNKITKLPYNNGAGFRK